VILAVLYGKHPETEGREGMMRKSSRWMRKK
jgi:hypothetical protein